MLRWGAVAVVTLVALLYFATRRSSSQDLAAVRPQPRAAAVAGTERSTPAPSHAGRRAARSAALRPLPFSLAGTDEVGGLAVGAGGDLVIDENLRRFFDYYLTALGEETIDEIRARLEAEIERRLPERAAKQARELLARYLELRSALADLGEKEGDLAQRVAEIRQLRRRLLGDEAATRMFVTGDALTDVELERQSLAAANLGDEERARRMAEAEAKLPEPLRVIREKAEAPVVSMKHEEALRQSGASAADIQAYRTARFGPEAAVRLSALDDRRAAWQGRVDAFRAARAEIEAAVPDVTLRNQRVAELVDSTFSGSEHIRIEALERIGGHPLSAP